MYIYVIMSIILSKTYSFKSLLNQPCLNNVCNLRSPQLSLRCILRLDKLEFYLFHSIIFVSFAIVSKRLKIQFDGSLLVSVASHSPQSFAAPPDNSHFCLKWSCYHWSSRWKQNDHQDVQDGQDHLSAVLDSASLNASYCLFTLANG